MVKVSGFSRIGAQGASFRLTNGWVIGGAIRSLGGVDAAGLSIADGVPLLADGTRLDPREMFAAVARAAVIHLVLEEENAAVEIAKSGAPEPSFAVMLWLGERCGGRWRYRDDGVWNLHFYFELPADAASFKERWGAAAP